MIRHIVGWNLKTDFTDEEQRETAAKIKAELEGLKNLIRETIAIHVEIEPAKNSTRQIILVSDFETEADLAAYQVHPEHKKVAAFVNAAVTDRVCLDFFVEGE